MGKNWRQSSQKLAPARFQAEHDQYHIYPAFPIGDGKLFAGFDNLASTIKGHPVIVIDGYAGVFWEEFRRELDHALREDGVSPKWFNVDQALLPEDQVDQLVEPFLGGDDPIFGTRFSGRFEQFFDKDQLAALKPDDASEVSIVYGCGAALTNWDGLVVFVDVPKNEIQFRSRSGSVTNLGKSTADSPKAMYKRFYFVDWVALNQHKKDLLSKIDVFVDGQRPYEPVMVKGKDLLEGLYQMSRNYFRVRPWFEPGAWGGQWMKEHIPDLPKEAPNYAWSFELITLENGLMIQSDDLLLEFSFDCLMYYDHHSILGDGADRFGYDFPIRFDYLDTFEGGNLSVQCHPRPEYIKKHFGEPFTQDETYYILDCEPEAEVYLGFQEGIEPQSFQNELERSQREGSGIDIGQFVNKEKSHRHDLFLIPNGTVHSSGKNNMVLEISATPYIFTFKMYDWMRLDLDGKPRPLNIPRAMGNLYFERQGKGRIQEELLSHPQLIEGGEDWRLYHLPTHPEHFYDVQRYEFTGSVDVEMNGQFHVLALVEGESIELETANGCKDTFHFAETFVIPAGAENYRLKNKGAGAAKVVKAFLKPEK